MAAVRVVGVWRDHEGSRGAWGFGLKEGSQSWFNVPVAVMDPKAGSESGHGDANPMA